MALGRLRDFEKGGYFTADIHQILLGMTPPMLAEVQRLAPLVREFLEELEVSLSLHESITGAMQRYIDDRADCAIISPTAIAAAIYDTFASDPVEPHVEYGCLEHFKGFGS